MWILQLIKLNKMNNTYLEAKISVLEQENLDLKHEIAMLRKQIDMLNNKSVEMKKQNDVLTEKMEEIKKNNSELEDLQKEKNDLFALIIHDIKNPTTVIKSLVELLSSYDTMTSDQQLIMQDLVASTRQIINLSNEVSKVLALEGTKVMMYRENADPTMLITEVARRNSINAKNKNQTINVNSDPDLPQFQVDVSKICEVFDNLVSNAIKYTQKGGKIVISAKQNGENIEVSVSDNGLGMSEEDLKRAFNRGMRLSAQPTGGESSSGLGLWIVKKIVEAHHGRVWIKSAVSRGTTFTVRIPIISPDGIGEESDR